MSELGQKADPEGMSASGAKRTLEQMLMSEKCQ
jgi:hypothetical protein